MMTENKIIIKSLGFYKRKMKPLNSRLQVFIQEGIWPFTNFVLKQKIISLIEKIQITIAYLGSLNKSSEALSYIEYFSFSLSNRFLSIENIRTRSSQDIFGMDKYDFKRCLYLVSLTHPKYIKTSFNLKMKRVMTLKKNISKIKILKIYDIVDRILQLQMLTFLDPLIDVTLPDNSYGFRKGRSSLQAIAYLFRSIQFSDTSKYYLISVDIRKYLDFISHKFILDKFPFPLKYRDLLARWLKCLRVFESEKKIKMQLGFPQGFVLGFIICNFTIFYITKNFFKDSYFLQNLVPKNLKGKIPSIQATRFFISYADNIIIKVINQDEANYALKKLINKLSIVGLDIYSEKKGHIYDLSIKTKFDWLGYTFLTFPKNSLRYSKLVNCGKKFTCKVNILLLYITNTNFTFIKTRLKEEIKKLKHEPLFLVLQKVNSMLKRISSFYGFAEMSYRLDYLQHFIDRVFWRTLIEKFRYKGVRRRGWVARTFFVTRVSPLGLKWHLHFPIPDSSSLKKKNINALWCVNVSTFFKLQPISIYILPKKLRTNSFYIVRKEFNSYNFRTQECRVNYKDINVFGDLLK